MDPQAGGFENRTQIGDGRSLAIGTGDMNDRRKFPFRMIELLQQPMHPIEAEIDAARMQARQSRDQIVDRGLWLSSGDVHACGTAGAGSAAGTMISGSTITCGAALGALESAGDLVKSRQSRASVERSS